MRIATSTLYSENTNQIDNLQAQYAQQGTELSTGKSLNVPSDDPQQIAQDLAVRNDGAVTTQVGKNLTDLSNQLTTVDGALSSLTSILQSVRALTIQGASSTLNPSELQDMATQVNQMFQEAVGLANTQYAGKYVFSGTAVPAGNALVTAVGSPPTGVTSQSNNVLQTQQLPNGQTVPTNVTLGQAFNYNASDGSPSVFQVLANLYSTLQNGTISNESPTQINLPGTYVNYSAGAAGTTLTQMTVVGAGQVLATPLVTGAVPALGGAQGIEMNIANAQSINGVNVAIPATDNMNQAVAAINTQLSTAVPPVSITASFDQQTQRITFTSTQNPNQTFEIQDIVGNFALGAMGLSQQATVSSDIGTQLTDIDNVTEQLLNTRASVGAAIQTVDSTNQTSDAQVLNDTAVQSNIEDTDIPKVTSEFSQTQTVLQAAYATTSRLESKTLFDYLS